MTESPPVLVGPPGVLETDCVVHVLSDAGLHSSTAPSATPVAAAVALDVPGHTLGATVGALRAQAPGAALLLLVPEVDERAMELVQSASAGAVLPWRSSDAAVVRAVRDMLRGATSRVEPPHVARATVRDPLGSLTSRELDILTLLAEGRRNREIASSLGISPHTVRTHVQHVLSKLGVSHRHAAAALVRRASCVRPNAHAFGRPAVETGPVA